MKSEILKKYKATDMKKLLVSACCVAMLLFSGSLAAQSIEVKQSDKIKTDNGTPGKANPGDVIQYKVTITNNGASNAEGVQLNVTPDMLTTFQNGTFRTSPLAFPDAYTCTGNVGITVLAANGLKNNDFDDDVAGLSITPVFNQATTQGGTVTINADGSFTYTPPAGFTGDDTFTYTLTDGNPVGAPIPDSDMGTVTITVSNMIWFVDNTGGGSGGTGTLADPFKTPADFNASALPAAGHIIFLKNTGADYTSGFVLKNNQTLFGSGHTGGANLADVLPFSLASNSSTLPAINGTSPVITNASGNGVTLAQGNTVRGINIGNTSGYAFADNGGTIGTATINEVNITGSGGIFSLANGGTINATLGTMSSSNSTNTPISLVNMAGNITNTSGAVSNDGSNNLIAIAGGTVNITTSTGFGKIGGAGILVSIVDGHTGTLTFNGYINNSSSTAQGIVLNNADGIYNFNGITSLVAGTAGINIENGSGGTFNLTNTNSEIRGITGISFRVNNSSMTINFSGDITHTSPTNRGVELIGATGAITFDANSSLQIGTNPTPMTTAVGIFLDNTGNTNQISFNQVFILAGVSGNTASSAFVSQTSGRIAMTTGSIICEGNIGNDNHCVDISDTTSDGFTVSTFYVDYDDTGENGGAIALNNTPGNFTFSTIARLVGTNATMIEGNNFGTLTVGSVTNNTITTQNRPLMNLQNGNINIQATIMTTSNTTTYGIRLKDITGAGLTASGAVTISSVAGASESILLDNVDATAVSLGAASTVTINNRRSNGIHATGCAAALTFGNTTINNPNSVTVPAVRSTSCSGATTFAQANIDMNSAGGFESFTNVTTPNDNSGDGDAMYISNYTGSGFTINGGIIQNTGDDGIDIRNSQNLNLNGVTIRDAGKNGGISGCVTDCNTSGVQAYNLTGTNTVTNSTFLRGRLRNFYFSLASGTSTLNISNSTFDDTRSLGIPATDNLQIYTSGSANGSFDIENSSFLRSRTDQISAIALNNSTISKLDITGITMDNAGGPSAGIRIGGEDGSTVNFNVMNNVKLYSEDENVVTIAASSTAQVQGRIKDNSDMKFNTPSSGSAFVGIRVLSDGTTSKATVLIENNSLVVNNGTDGINISVQGTSGAQINATVREKNTINATGTPGVPLEGINAFVNAGGTSKKLCLTVENNTVTGIWARALRVRALGPTGVEISNFTTNVATTWTNNGNTGSPVVEFASGGTIMVAAVACPLPNNPLP